MKRTITAALIALTASQATAGTICKETDRPSHYFEITGDVILRHQPYLDGTKVVAVWKRDEGPCLRQDDQPGDYNNIALFADGSLMVHAWGNVGTGNHGMSVTRVTCSDQP